MKYSPKKTDLKIRIIYGALFVLAVFCMLFNFDPSIKVYFSSVGLLSLVSSLYLFIKLEFTTYEYILIERNDTLDFYVNKIVGRRGNYVCYFPLSDALELCEYTSESKARLKEQYKNPLIYKYNQNVLCGKRYALVFENDNLPCVIVIEPNDELISHIEKELSRQKEIKSLDNLETPDTKAEE